MSRIGKNPVEVPEGVNVDVVGQVVKAKGPKGELQVIVHDDVSVKMVDGKVKLEQRVNSIRAKKLWPTMRTLVGNIVHGVKEGYTESLEIQGVGYRCALQGSVLVLQLGFSHEVRYNVPEGIKITVTDQTKLKIEGIDKQAVGQSAAKIRSFKRPEPYKGKGIRYVGEYVFMKEGKKK